MVDQFPFKSSLRLSNIIGFWELQQYSDNPIIAQTAKDILKRIEEVPFLRGEIEDTSQLAKHQELIDSILSAVIAPGLAGEQILGVFKPFSMEFFYSSPKFKELTTKAGSLLNLVKHLDPIEITRKKTLAAYQAILFQFYGAQLPADHHMVLTLDEENGLQQHFHLSLNTQFCEIILDGELPQLTENDLNHLIQNPDKLELWMEKLPPEHFIFAGFGIYLLTEATHLEIVQRVKETLLAGPSSHSDEGESFFKYLEHQFQSLTEIPDLTLGISSFHKIKNSYNACGESGSWSLLVDQENNFIKTFHEISEEIKETRKAIIIPDIANSKYFQDCQNFKCGTYKGIIIAPLFTEDEFIGHLELASKAKSLTSIDYAKVSEILPLFANAMKRKLEDMENQIQSIVKETYTSIHPSVEWKFTEAAFDILQKRSIGKEGDVDIVFKDVYPLYGSSDIRNSSVQRNEAIVADLTDQLKIAEKVFTKARSEYDFPVIGETIYRIRKQVNRLKKGLISGDENSILNFLHKDVEPMIRDLELDIPKFKKTSKEYWNSLDAGLGIVYNKRKNFEDSLTQINEAVSSFLEEEQVKAQEMFPHYFEKYKTDGVEYNIYIGDSINRDKRFSNLYLKNLRLWQLLVTIEVGRRTNELKKELSLPLDTVHLILVHSQPLSVRFRLDEKQFDVDGAYNIRYEIVKKRIDKVHIKGTDERLTQPNTLSIVYSHEEDQREYLSYLEYLRHQGHIGQHFEQFQLEELQGVSGLKAFRVSIEPKAKGILKELNELTSANKILVANA